MNDLWEKYGLTTPDLDLCIYLGRWLCHDELSEYVQMCCICHDFVSSYLEDNPEVAAKHKTPGFMYYNILQMASPEYLERVAEWSIMCGVRSRSIR
jgi:hypothetical protein